MDLSFDPPDPLARINARLSGLGGGFQPRAEYRKPFSPDEMRPLTQQFLDYGQPGLRSIASTLSAPGEYTKGLMTGNFGKRVTGREQMNKYGLTDPNDRGWGAWGLGLAADIAFDPLTYTPFGAKHVLTPMGKVLSKAGKLGTEMGTFGREAMLGGFHATEPELVAAGRTAAEIAHLKRGGMIAGLNEPGNFAKGMTPGPWRVASEAQDAMVRQALGRGIVPGERLGGMFGFGLPFRDPVVTFGGGAIGRGLARGLDVAGSKLKFGNLLPGVSPGRFWNSLFDSKVMGAMDEPSQRGISSAGYGQFLGAQRGARKIQYQATEKLEPLLRQFPGREREILHVARALGEDATRARFDPAVVSAIQQSGLHEMLPKYYRDMYKQMRRAGVDTTEWKNAEGLRYMRADTLYGNRDLLQPKYSIYPTHMSMDVHREKLFNQAGGRARVDEWTMQHAGSKLPVRTIQRDIFRDLVYDRRELSAMRGNAGPIGRDTLKQLNEQARDLAAEMKGLSGAHVANKEPLFDPNLVGSVGNYGYMAGRKLAAARGMYGSLAHQAVPFDINTMAATHLSIPEFLRQLKGFETHRADKSIGVGRIHGAQAEILKLLASKGAPPAEAILKQKSRKQLTQAVGQFGVPKEFLDAARRSYAKAQAPEQLSAPLRFLDSFNNLFKAMAYPIWPASHDKNIVTGLINNLRTQGPINMVKDLVAQARMLREPGLGSAATRAERLRQYTHANIGGGNDALAELAGMSLPTGQKAPGRITMKMPMGDRAGPTGNLPGDVANLMLKEGLFDTARNVGRAGASILGKPWSPARWGEAIGKNLGVKGVAGLTEDTLPIVGAGRKASMNIEDWLRGGMERGLRRQGYDPTVAGELVNKYHFAYDRLTDFEKNVMRRVFPFYTFMSRNIPMQIETMLTRPGITMAQLYPALQERHKNPYIPDYLQGNVSIPLGPGSEPGHQKFIGSLGLPIEEAFSRFQVKGGMPDLPATAMGFMGNMNPLIKAIVEPTFDRQLFSGRRLSDLKAPATARMLGRVFGEENPQFLAQLLANTPASRFATTMDRLVDPKKTFMDKAINVLTGAKVTDVNVDQQRAIEARNALEQQLRQHPHFSSYTNWYIRPDMVGKLPPGEVEMMRELATMQKAARDYVEEQKNRSRGIGVQVPLAQ